MGKEVVVNDRASTDALGPTTNIEENDDGDFHGDFVTPEYASFDEIREEKWEACWGIGHSFGYNESESEDDHLIGEELVHSFVDIVSKNGNLLLNGGPKADGTIPEIQVERLRALGEWLDVNGATTFGTRPWVVAEDDDTYVTIDCTIPRDISSTNFSMIGTEGKLYVNNDDGDWRYWSLEDSDHVERNLAEFGIESAWTGEDNYKNAFANAAEHVQDLLDGAADNHSTGREAIRSLEIIVGLYVSHHTAGTATIPLDRTLRDVCITSW